MMTSHAPQNAAAWLIDPSLVAALSLPPKDPPNDDEDEEDEEDEEEDEEPAVIREPNEC